MQKLSKEIEAPTLEGINKGEEIILPNKSSSGDYQSQIVRLRRNAGPHTLTANRMSTLPVNKRLGILQDANGNYITGHTMEQLAQYKSFKPVIKDKETGELVYNKEFFSNYFIFIGSNGLTLNMDIERDRFVYRVLATGIYPFIAVNPENVATLPSSYEFYITNEEEVAKQRNKKAELKFRAFELLYKLSEIERIDLLSFFSLPTKNVNAEVAKAKLTEVAETKPQELISALENKTRFAQTVVFKKAIEYRVLYYSTKQQGFVYNDNFLGATEDEAINKINAPGNENLKASILKAVNKPLE